MLAAAAGRYRDLVFRDYALPALAWLEAQAAPSIADYQQNISGSATPKDLETALQLNFLAQTAPNMTPDVLELLKRRILPSLQNRDQSPGAMFGEKVEQVGGLISALSP